MSDSPGTRWSIDARWSRIFVRTRPFLGLMVTGLLLVGGYFQLAACGTSKDPHTAVQPAESIPLTSEAAPIGEVRLASLLPISESFNNARSSDGMPEVDPEAIYWALPNQGSAGPVLFLPPLVRLPQPDFDIAVEPEIPQPEPLPAPTETPSEPIGYLLPPQAIPSEESILVAEDAAIADTEPAQEPITPTLDGLSDEERQLVEQVVRDTTEAATGVLTDARVNEMATTRIRQANVLSQRGATFAARQKLIEVLRMVSQAKDARLGKLDYSSALAAGLRALEEAEDFAPHGAGLEAELELDLITAAHRTTVAQRLESDQVLPQQMMIRYLRYAQVKLAMSVAGDPAGSMALYALGKITSQMGKSEPERHRLAHRRAVAFQQAALLSHNQNYLAAHELAVLLAESGHFAESQDLLLQVAVRQPQPTVYRNLARVQKRLGLVEQAAASRALAAQLSSQGRGGANQIQWLAPQEFGRAMSPTQFVPPNANAQLPMVRRPQYDRRTAMAPATTSIRRPPGQTRPPNWH